MFAIKSYLIEILSLPFIIWSNGFLNFILFPSFSFYVSHFSSILFHFISNNARVFLRFCQGTTDISCIGRTV